MIDSRKMPRALVTGADGFIGSHLVELLVSRGWHVRALVHYNSFGSWGWLDQCACRGEVEVLLGDVRDPDLCRRMTSGIDVVFHLAALIAIPYSYGAPTSYIDTNVRGTLNMCQAARENGIKRFIQVSTSEVYGTARYVPMDESHPLQPQSPYSASKIGADSIAMSYFYSFDLPVTVARPFNTYGPRQSARAVIPSIIVQIAAGRQRVSLGDLRPTRDFNFVEDTCRGFVALAECEAAIGETVNIGTSREVTIQATLEMIRDLMNSDIEFVFDQQRARPEKSEVMRLYCDNRKMRELTGHEPQVSLKEGLTKTIEWFTDPDMLAKYKVEVYNT